MRFGLENPRDYRVVFMGAAAEFAAVVVEEKQRSPTFQVLVDRVRECIADGVLREGEPDAIAVVIWARVHGLVSLRLSGHLTRIGTDTQFAEFYDRAAERLIAGLGA